MNIKKTKVSNTELLIVDDVPQSANPPPDFGYWKHMIPENFQGKEVLMLGVAGGTIARLLLKKYPNIKITGVDNNSKLVSDAPKMNLLIQDGFKFIKETKKKFDLIIVDIFNGYWFPFKVLSEEFIEDCERILNKDGYIYINTPNLRYFAEENLKKLEIYRDIGKNIIYVHK